MDRAFVLSTAVARVRPFSALGKVPPGTRQGAAEIVADFTEKGAVYCVCCQPER